MKQDDVFLFLKPVSFVCVCVCVHDLWIATVCYVLTVNKSIGPYIIRGLVFYLSHDVRGG